jgi:hypothetical protein
MKSRGKGPGLFMKMIAHIINWAVLPPGVEFQWDEQDPEEDKAVADVASVRGLDRKARIESGEITPTVARQLALQVGDLTQEMVDQLEEEDEQAAAAASAAPPVQPQAEQSTLEEGATPEGQTTPGEQETVDEEAQRSIGDDRAGPPVTDAARTESERALAENIENAFAAARERLIRRVGA